MTNEKKTAPDALDEKALEGVAGGGFTMPSPVLPKQCPCEAYISRKRDADRVQCPNCGRWYRVVDGILIEEK